MQDRLTRNWTRKRRGASVFGTYTVTGFQYKDPLGQIGWHITAWPVTGPIRDYWVSDKMFYSVRIHYFYQLTNRALIEIFGAIPDLDLRERSAVLKAISEWETPSDATEHGL